MKSIKNILRWIAAAVIAAAAATGCVEEMEQQQDYGFVQFRLLKSGSFTKANNGVLDSLYEASKLQITLMSESGESLSPTVPVMETDAASAEYGVQSEKFRLYRGNYTIIGYKVYNVVDKEIFSETDARIAVEVTPGGLTLTELSVETVERGFVKFRLVTTEDDALVEIDRELDAEEEEILGRPSEAMRASAEGDGAMLHPFHQIMSVDITVQNVNTNEKSTFTNLKTVHGFVESSGDVSVASVCQVDSLVPVKAGKYKVTGFRTYFDRARKVYETSGTVPENSFTVRDNQITGLLEDAEDEELRNADVPVTLHAEAGYIRDAIALRKIWLDHDGPHWKEKGFPVIWNFDADVNVWLAQPGVQILEDGRVALLNFEGTGVEGRLSDHIGDLTALRQIYFGSHAYQPGVPKGAAAKSGRYDRELIQYEKEKNSFKRTFYGNRNPLVKVFENSPYLLESIGNNGIDLRMDEPPMAQWPSDKDTKSYSCLVTELPESINNLVNLESLYIGFGAMLKLPDDMSGMENLTDVEIFNSYDMTEFPMGLATLPNLISLTFANNIKVNPESTIEGLRALNSGSAGKTLQLLYLPSQPINGEFPDVSAIQNLSLLNVQNCGITGFEAAFGKDRPFVDFLAAYNDISSLPTIPDEKGNGYFIGMSSETENIDFSHNEFTKLPNIFLSNSVFTMGTIDFSYNKIDGVEGGENYRGVNCTTLNLGGNRLTKWPEELLGSGSYISFLQLQQNGMEEIEDEAIENHKYTYAIQVMDLSYNKLSKLPDAFNSHTFQYLGQLDMSYNRFDRFPYAAVNSQYMLTFVFRGQRDADGNRCMKEWPTGIGQNLFRLRALFLGSNDIRKVDDNLSYLIYNLDISDNPNISIDVTDICPYIKAGMFSLIYSPNQDIRGCDGVLTLDR